MVVSPQVSALRALFGAIRPANHSGRVDSGEPERPIKDPCIAIVDDQAINVKIVQKYLKLAGYGRFVSSTDAREAIALIDREEPDIVLLDIMMPYVSGLDILAELRRGDKHADLPVIILTAASEKQTKIEALKLGATEFLLKPIDSAELDARVRNVLTVKAHQDRVKRHAWVLEAEVAARSAELVAAHREVVQCLAAVGEYRDNETGQHVVRVGRYAEVIAQYQGMSKEFCDRIRDAAPLHDIGKVGIPDCILRKPGKLDDLEFKQMMRHVEYGETICSHGHCHQGGTTASHTAIGLAVTRVGGSPILQMAGTIAHTHHERWDGKGYPRGLQGEAIPIEGRITAVADVFDALTSHRPYKKAFPLDKSLEIIDQQRGTQFDPGCVDAFFAGIERIIAVYHEFADAVDAATPPDAAGVGGMQQDLDRVESGGPPPAIALPGLTDLETCAEQSTMC